MLICCADLREFDGDDVNRMAFDGGTSREAPDPKSDWYPYPSKVVRILHAF
jgi:hypothetical protein